MNGPDGPIEREQWAEERAASDDARADAFIERADDERIDAEFDALVSLS